MLPIQPKDITELLSQQKQQQAHLTQEEWLQHLIKYRDSLESEPGARALIRVLDEEIRKLKANIELQQGLNPKRG